MYILFSFSLSFLLQFFFKDFNNLLLIVSYQNIYIVCTGIVLPLLFNQMQHMCIKKKHENITIFVSLLMKHFYDSNYVNIIYIVFESVGQNINFLDSCHVKCSHMSFHFSWLFASNQNCCIVNISCLHILVWRTLSNNYKAQIYDTHLCCLPLT